jgi:hypothetical protein
MNETGKKPPACCYNCPLAPETLENAIYNAINKAIKENLAALTVPKTKKEREKADRKEEIRQEVAGFVEKQIEFTGNWCDIIKEHEMYMAFKAECIGKNPISKTDFSNQLRTDYPRMKFGRNKQDVAIWHNIRLKD